MLRDAHRRGRVQEGVAIVLALIVLVATFVVATTSVIMTLTVGTIFVLMRAESSGATALSKSSTLSRLATDFRRDAHAATEARLVPANADEPAKLGHDRFEDGS